MRIGPLVSGYSEEGAMNVPQQDDTETSATAGAPAVERREGPEDRRSDPERRNSDRVAAEDEPRRDPDLADRRST